MNYQKGAKLSSFVGIFFFFGGSEKTKFSDYYYCLVQLGSLNIFNLSVFFSKIEKNERYFGD